MSNRYVQMSVTQDDFDIIRRQAFEEKLTLSELLEKTVKFYLEKGGGVEERIKKSISKQKGK